MNPFESSDHSNAEKNHQLPDGSWVSLRVESDSLYSKWSCFWLTFTVGKVRPAWYRVFPVGTVPPEWKSMKPAGVVHKQTGGDDEDDEDPDETERENEGKIGAAKKLSVGRYVLRDKILMDDQDVELTAFEFRVARGPTGAGWG